MALIVPGTVQVSDTPPLNMGMLAACLEAAGHEVKIVDKLAGHDFQRELLRFSPDFAGVTGTTPVISDAYRCADFCRSQKIFTIMGGVHASIMPEETLSHADAVVVGEGEKTIVDIVENETRGIVRGEPAMDLDELPFPAYHLIDMEYYVTLLQRVVMSFAAIAPSWTRLGVLLTSRGCPHNCAFCHNSYRTLPFRWRSPKLVVDEMQLLADAYGVSAIFFVEDNLFANRKRVLEICRLIKDAFGGNVAWGANARVDNVDLIVLEAAREAGCKQVTFGWESGSQRMLNVLGKGTTVEQNNRSIELCNAAKVNASGTVMIGSPTETVEDIELTRSFLANNHITGGIGVCLTTPYPGTRIWDWCKENNRLPEHLDWAALDFHHLPINMTDIPNNVLMRLHNELNMLSARKFSETMNERMSR